MKKFIIILAIISASVQADWEIADGNQGYQAYSISPDGAIMSTNTNLVIPGIENSRCIHLNNINQPIPIYYNRTKTNVIISCKNGNILLAPSSRKSYLKALGEITANRAVVISFGGVNIAFDTNNAEKIIRKINEMNSTRK